MVDLDCGGAESQPTGHDAERVSHCGRRGCQFILGIIISEDMGGILRKRGAGTLRSYLIAHINFSLFDLCFFVCCCCCVS